MDGMAMEKYWDPILQCRTFAWLITVCGCAAILLLADHNSPFTINMNAVSSASVSSRGRSAPWSLSSCNCDVHINCFMSIGALDFEMDHSIIERESGEKKNSIKEQYHQYLFQTKSRSGRCLVFSINDGVVCIWRCGCSCDGRPLLEACDSNSAWPSQGRGLGEDIGNICHCPASMEQRWRLERESP